MHLPLTAPAALSLALALAASAAAAPVAGVQARHDGRVLDVTALVLSPPEAAGCAVAVRVSWSRTGGGGTRAASPGPVPGAMVTKADDDGTVAVDACAELGRRPMWTRGRAHVRFRTAAPAPGAYRVCVEATQARADGGLTAGRACTALRVPPPRP